MKRSLLFAWVTLAACVPARPSYEGKLCDGEGRCPSGYVCNPYLLVCTQDANAGCNILHEPPSTCTGVPDELYLSPTGSDSRDGSAASPRRTLAGLTLRPGTRIHLAPGNYHRTLEQLPAGGQQGCPLVMLGEPGHVAETFVESLVINASHWRVQDLTVRPTSSVSIGVAFDKGPDDIVLERVIFQRDESQGVPNGAADTWSINDGCQGCTFLGCEFKSSTINIQQVTGKNLVVRNCRFDSSYLALNLNGDRTLVEGNTFTGTFGDAVIKAAPGLSVTVARNVFRQIVFDGPVVRGASSLLHNTFAEISGNAAAAADDGTFRNNIVRNVGRGLLAARPADADYNLFDRVDAPYGSGGLGPHDVSGTAALGADAVPGAGSAAIDRADPAFPAPPQVAHPEGGFGDIGAREVGARQLPDGRYCVNEPWADSSL